jgi:hypothetical protein
VFPKKFDPHLQALLTAMLPVVPETRLQHPEVNQEAH